MAREQLGMYGPMMEEYEAHREQGTKCPPLTDFTDTFNNDDTKIRIEIYLVPSNSNEPGGLEKRQNNRDLQRHSLQHYHTDVLGFPPKSREEKKLRCLVDYFVWEQFVMSFQRGGNGEMGSLEWQMQEYFPPFAVHSYLNFAGRMVEMYVALGVSDLSRLNRSVVSIQT